MSKNKVFGERGEEAAAKHLVNEGYNIICKNWKGLKYEIDIICTFDDLLIFIEVKTRSTAEFSNPAESVNREKQRRIIEAADDYIQTNKYQGDCRFDIISIVLKENITDVEHIKDAFFPEFE